jgi:4-hydroxymandelate oxidase
MAGYLDSDALTRLYAVEEFEPIARENMSAVSYGYISGAAGSGSAQVANREAYTRWVFRPRALVDVSTVDLTTKVLGRPIDLPVMFAPTSLHVMAHPDGELATAGAARELNTIMIVSTGASRPLEEIGAALDGKWFQLYWLRKREITRDLVQRAEAAGYEAICLTVDSAVFGWRENEARVPVLPQPGITAANLPPDATDEELDFEPTVTWRSLEWIRSITRLPVVLKGIMTAEDANLAIEHGVDAIVVSNHGGRQLDSAMATLDALPEVVDAVGGRVDVLMDGGIRRGADVLKALALGAQAVLIGRPVFWGIGAGGTAGLLRLVELMRGELFTAMALTGVTSATAVPRSIIAPNPAGR